MIAKCFSCNDNCKSCTLCEAPIQYDKYDEVYCLNGHHLGLIHKGKPLQEWRDEEAISYCKMKKRGKK